MGRGRTGVLVTRAAIPEIAGPALAGDERDGGEHALLGRGGPGTERLGGALALVGGPMDRGLGGEERLEHRLVARLGLAQALDAALADGAGLGDALRAAATAADQGSDATIPLVARKGRASYLGERSAGHRDPGATSTALLVNTAAASLG